MVQIFDAPSSPWDLLSQGAPKAGDTIASMIGQYKQNKALNSAAQGLANQQGHPELAQVYKQILLKDPSKIADMILSSDIEQPYQESERSTSGRQVASGNAVSKDGLGSNRGQVRAREEGYGQVGQRTQAPADTQVDNYVEKHGPKRPKVPFSERQIARERAINVVKANSMLQQNEAARKDFNSERKFQTQGDAGSDKFLGEIEKDRSQLAQDESALSRMSYDIENGDLGAFSGDYLADLTHFEGFRSAKGADLINATKEFFLGSISRVGARPNQFVEQQISRMMPKLGRSREANLTVLESFKFASDLKRKRLALADDVADEFYEKNGYVPRQISKIVDQKMKPYVEQRQKELMQRFKDIESEAKEGLPLAKKGQKLTPNEAKRLLDKYNNDWKAAAKKAEELGYVVE